MFKPEHLEKENLLRHPVDYHTMGGSLEESYDDRAVAARYKYYSRLADSSNNMLTMPVHVVPSVFVFRAVRTDKDDRQLQRSWVTIFSLWNTMMGTTLLSVPWAIQQAGFVNGILLLLLMCALMLYTSYRTLTSVTGVNRVSSEKTEVAANAVVCPSMYNGTAQNVSMVDQDSTFFTYWDEQKTAPFLVLIMVAPLVNFKSPTFFTKLNAMGAVTVCYMLVFVTIMAARWGINFQARPPEHLYGIPEFKATFPTLTGVAVFGYFVQNSLLSITRTQKQPENNVRDLVIAYILVACTYLYMGTLLYISFPINKQCIEDNLLKNISDSSVLGFVARIGLLVQLLSIFPLLIYVFRLQFMTSLYGEAWPGLRRVLILNVTLVGLSLLFAIYLPHIGRILGFVGAWCGFSYGFALPCLVYMKQRYRSNTLTKWNITVHVFLIVLGGANFVAQFALL